jgi:hypothetical protein
VSFHVRSWYENFAAKRTGLTQLGSFGHVSSNSND